MKDFEFYEIVGNPETITEEMFNSFTRSVQLDVLEYRPDLLEFFQKNYPDLTADEEIELIRHGWLDFKDAKNKTQFSGDGILKLILSETISQTEFEQYGCDKKLEPRHWVEVLGYFGVVCKWCEPYCDFSRFQVGIGCLCFLCARNTLTVVRLKYLKQKNLITYCVISRN